MARPRAPRRRPQQIHASMAAPRAPGAPQETPRPGLLVRLKENRQEITPRLRTAGRPFGWQDFSASEEPFLPYGKQFCEESGFSWQTRDLFVKKRAFFDKRAILLSRKGPFLTNGRSLCQERGHSWQTGEVFVKKGPILDKLTNFLGGSLNQFSELFWPVP